MSSFFKTPKWENENYLDFVRGLPCVVCGTTIDVVPHHIKGVGHYSGAGLKADDSLTMPMCCSHHREWHDSPDYDAQFKWTMDTLNKAIKAIKAGELAL